MLPRVAVFPIFLRMKSLCQSPAQQFLLLLTAFDGTKVGFQALNLPKCLAALGRDDPSNQFGWKPQSCHQS